MGVNRLVIGQTVTVGEIPVCGGEIWSRIA